MEEEEDDDVYAFDPSQTKPRIRLYAGKQHRIAAAAERVLALDGSYYHSGGSIVRLVEEPGSGVLAAAVNDQTLLTVLSAKVDWEKWSKTEWVRCDVPPAIVQNLLRGQDRRFLKRLDGIARQPFFAPNGTLIGTPGYHAETGIYGAYKAVDFEMPAPTRIEAEHALAELKWLVSEFPFATDADRAAAICAMLTAAVRPGLPLAPAFSINAPRSGSGKSYLAQAICQFAGPDAPYVVSYPTRAEEAAKLILAALLEKPAVIFFDDMQTGWLPFGAINKAITSATTTERILGSTRTATASTNVFILGTGNNVEPKGDMRRRVVSIRLEPSSETPALQRFEKRPVEIIAKDRPWYVTSALTIIAAYLAEGAPSPADPIGSFEVWSERCRQPLLWLGLQDPATSLIEQVFQDDDQLLLAELLEVWANRFDERSKMVREVCAFADSNEKMLDVLTALELCDHRGVNPNKLGWYLSKNQGRRAGGLRFERGNSSERRSWRVVRS